VTIISMGEHSLDQDPHELVRIGCSLISAAVLRMNADDQRATIGNLTARVVTEVFKRVVR
jgi:hypothetical protein